MLMRPANKLNALLLCYGLLCPPAHGADVLGVPPVVASFRANVPAHHQSVLTLQGRAVERTALNGEPEQSTKAALPMPCKVGRTAEVTDSIRGLWRCTGTGWDSVTGAANVKDFGAAGVPGATTSNVAAGRLTLTLTDAATYQPGHGVLVTGAGARGADYLGTVAAVAGNTITLDAPAPATTVSNALVKHDDTAAWQAALNAAGARDTGRVLAPEGVYYINGPLQGTSGFEGRLLLPYSTTVGRSIEIAGASIPNQTFGTVPTSAYAPSNAGTVLVTTKAGGAMFSTGTNAFVGTRPVFRNLTLRQVDNPQGSLLDCRYCHGVVIEHSFFDTGTYTTHTSNPTNITSFGIRTPVVGNDGDTLISHTLVAGFFFGIEMGEHLRLDYVTVNACARPLYIPTAQNDGITGSYLSVYNSPYTIAADASALLSFQMLNIEHVDPTDGTQQVWQRPAAGGDVYDPSNALRGLVAYNIIKENVLGTCATADSEFTVTGAAKLGMDNLCDAPILIATFFNSWVNAGGGEAPAGYYSKNGETHLTGGVKNGTLGNTAFQLPARYCPAHTHYFTVLASAFSTGYVSVGPASGATCPVTVQPGTNNAFVSLDGIVFGRQ
jgi:hypothetical protein